mmetsp:Transcript_21082/g.37644  ORF Transcript_21082/g.37644 Transcript_21082/m.37644 type:complete len:104 (-) Transcript_21082:1264-1575(-)
MKRIIESDDGLEKENQLSEKIRHQLIESGVREELKAKLVEKLSSCGWLDDVKSRAREYATSRGGQVTTEEIVRAICSEGRATVPDNLKAELLYAIKQFILKLE